MWTCFLTFRNPGGSDTTARSNSRWAALLTSCSLRAWGRSSAELCARLGWCGGRIGAEGNAQCWSVVRGAEVRIGITDIFSYRKANHHNYGVPQWISAKLAVTEQRFVVDIDRSGRQNQVPKRSAP